MCNSCGDRGEPFVTTQPHPTSDEIPDAPGKWYRPLELSWWDCDIETADDEGAENRLSLADVQKLHEKFTKRWRSSIEYQKLRTFFNEVVLNLDAMQITSWTKFTISHVYFQDPRFNAIDSEFLLERGYEILHTPESDKYASTETFLFAPFGDPRPIISSIHTAYPPLLITTDLSVHRWFHRLDEDTEIPSEAPLQRQSLLSFLNKCVAKRLPNSENVDWLRAHFIYYRPLNEKDLIPVKFDIAEEKLFPIVEDEARVLWEERKSEGGDLSGYIQDPDVHDARDATRSPPEGNDEWPVSRSPAWKEKAKSVLETFAKIGRWIW